MTIRYTVGDATFPEGDGPKIIAHVVNDLPAWGAGFVLAVSKRWPQPRQRYFDWARQRPSSFLLGSVDLVPVEPELWVANMLAQHGIRPRRGPGVHGPLVQYDALRQCLYELSWQAKIQRASVHMPRIGCGLAGGEWSIVEGIIDSALVARGIDVVVYDLPGQPFRKSADTS